MSLLNIKKYQKKRRGRGRYKQLMLYILLYLLEYNWVQMALSSAGEVVNTASNNLQVSKLVLCCLANHIGFQHKDIQDHVSIFPDGSHSLLHKKKPVMFQSKSRQT